MQPVSFLHTNYIPSSSGGTVAVTRLSFNDSAAISTLEKCCFDHGWNTETIMESFTLPAFRAYGIRLSSAGKELAAYVTVYHIGDVLEILNLGVHPSMRRQGFGRLLLGSVLREVHKEGILESVLDVRVGNTPAIALYESLGYARSGLRKGYYSDTGEDALLYTLHMNQLSF